MRNCAINKKIKILHIAAHLGEGVGKAIGGLAVADAENQHEIVLLDRPLKMGYVENCRRNGIVVHICPDASRLAALVASCDVLLVSWWDHPLAIPFLYGLKDIPARVMLWSHINGLNYPLLPGDFVAAFDACLFTSPVSLDLPQWTAEERDEIFGKSELVYGTGDFHPEQQPCKRDFNFHEPVRIGYVGTLDYAKLHPEYLKYCKAALDYGIEAEFLLAGEPTDALRKDVQQFHLADYVEFLGYRRDVPDLLPTFDIFGYLLNKNTFATTENSLLEAMAAGLPVVTSNGVPESAIVTDGEDGFIAGTPAEYAEKIGRLLENESLRQSLGNHARARVCERYGIDENVSRFHRMLRRVMQKKKTMHDFRAVLGDSLIEAFLSGCNETARQIFEAALRCTTEEEFLSLKKDANALGDIFKTKRKSSPFQFLQYFPDDAKLQKICKLFGEGVVK